MHSKGALNLQLGEDLSRSAYYGSCRAHFRKMIGASVGARFTAQCIAERLAWLRRFPERRPKGPGQARLDSAYFGVVAPAFRPPVLLRVSSLSP